jgi:hypothetical protein
MAQPAAGTAAQARGVCAVARTRQRCSLRPSAAAHVYLHIPLHTAAVHLLISLQVWPPVQHKPQLAAVPHPLWLQSRRGAYRQQRRPYQHPHTAVATHPCPHPFKQLPTVSFTGVRSAKHCLSSTAAAALPQHSTWCTSAHGDSAVQPSHMEGTLYSRVLPCSAHVSQNGSAADHQGLTPGPQDPAQPGASQHPHKAEIQIHTRDLQRGGMLVDADALGAVTAHTRYTHPVQIRPAARWHPGAPPPHLPAHSGEGDPVAHPMAV